MSSELIVYVLKAPGGAKECSPGREAAECDPSYDPALEGRQRLAASIKMKNRVAGAESSKPRHDLQSQHLRYSFKFGLEQIVPDRF
jgi:hypothetical protein